MMRETWPCPSCGEPVSLPEDRCEGLVAVDDLDRLAHALCGCYILQMSNASLSRLLSAIIDPEGPEATR